MTLFDPFYGVSNAGVTITRWMNRILLVAEVAVAVWFGIFLHKEIHLSLGFYLWSPVFLLLFIHLTNVVMRWMWNIIMVIIYGTTDTEVITESYRRRQEKRERKALAAAEAARQAKIEEARKCTPVRISGGKVDYGPDYEPDPPKCVTDMFL